MMPHEMKIGSCLVLKDKSKYTCGVVVVYDEDYGDGAKKLECDVPIIILDIDYIRREFKILYREKVGYIANYCANEFRFV